MRLNIEFVQYGIYFIGQEHSMLTLKQRVSFTLLKHTEARSVKTSLNDI